MIKYIFCLVLISTFILISCSDERYTDKGIEKIVNTTDSLLENLSGQEYQWASKSAYSTIMAYYPTTDIIFLNENLKYRSASEAINLYYFKDRALVRLVSRILDYSRRDDERVKKSLIKMTINFDPDGDVISYEKIENNKIVSLGNNEIDEILSHSKDLYNIVGDKEE